MNIWKLELEEAERQYKQMEKSFGNDKEAKKVLKAYKKQLEARKKAYRKYKGVE